MFGVLSNKFIYFFIFHYYALGFGVLSNKIAYFLIFHYYAIVFGILSNTFIYFLIFRYYTIMLILKSINNFLSLFLYHSHLSLPLNYFVLNFWNFCNIWLYYFNFSLSIISCLSPGDISLYLGISLSWFFVSVSECSFKCTCCRLFSIHDQ